MGETTLQLLCFGWGFLKKIQDICVGGMVFFILWLMTLEEGTFRV